MEPELNEIELTVLIRNNRVKKLRLQRGLTQRRLGKLIGVCPASIAKAEQFKSVPRVMELLAAFFDVEKEWLFPPGVVAAVRKTRATKEIPAASLPMLAKSEEVRLLNANEGADPEQAVLARERAEATREALKILKPREELAIKMWMDGSSDKEIAKALGVCRERASQIRPVALRKLRGHILRQPWDELKEFIGLWEA